MGKYAIHTKWEWPDGVPTADTMQGWHREFKSQTKAEDIIWFQIDENTTLERFQRQIAPRSVPEWLGPFGLMPFL